MGGVPIVYRFAVPAGSTATVVLGLCESHWNAAGQRPLRCRAEGAPEQSVDPVAKWGQHQPGLLVFQARDENGDGKLVVTVRPAAHAPDQNPILNVIWIFAAGETPALDKVLAGQLNDTALYYVDVGGDEGPVDLPARQDGVPRAPGGRWHAGTDVPGRLPRRRCAGAQPSDWSPDKLLRAVRDVWRDWSHP